MRPGWGGQWLEQLEPVSDEELQWLWGGRVHLRTLHAQGGTYQRRCRVSLSSIIHSVSTA